MNAVCFEPEIAATKRMVLFGVDNDMGMCTPQLSSVIGDTCRAGSGTDRMMQENRIRKATL
ncbi:MAG: hypothetical protein WD851_11825 [Pirellulales bacterium]